MKVLNKIISERRFIVILIVTAVIVRLIYTIYDYQTFGISKFCDDYDYISYGEEILKQGIFVPDIDKIHENGHQVGIGFPLILSFIFGIFGKNYFAVFGFNLLLSTCLCLLIFKIGKLVFNETTAVFSAIWSVFYINFIKYTPSVLKENLNHFLLAATVLLFLKAIKNRSYWQVLFFSVLYAFFIHVDERYAVFSILFAIGFFWLSKADVKFAVKSVGIYSVTTLIIMVPWLVRNFKVYERPVILAYQTAEFTDGFFRYDTASGKTGTLSMKTSYEKENLPIYEKITADLKAGKGLDSSYFKDYKYIKELPKAMEEGHVPYTFSFLENVWADFSEFFRPCRFEGGFIGNGYRYCPPWSRFHNLTYLLQYGLLIPFMLLGMFNAIRLANQQAIFLLFVILLYTAIHVLVVLALQRYRLPIDSFLLLFAFFGISALFKPTNADSTNDGSSPQQKTTRL